MYNVDHVIALACEPEQVFEALTEQRLLTAWFAPQVITVPYQGTIAAFAFEFDLNFKMELTELIPPSLVHWTCVDGYEEWVGSEVFFRISKKAGETLLHFIHQGLRNEEKREKTEESWYRYLSGLKDQCEKKAG